jgi:uncharacterized protein (TIGR03435 family)
VVDNTGLTGLFVVDIAFARLSSTDSETESVFSVIQALGLRLDSVQAPVDIVKVDRANQTPTPN